MAANQAEERTSKRARVDATLTNIADEWKCAITGELIVDPCIAEDGHVYERKEITTWLASHDTSPRTRATIGRRLVPSAQAKNTIEALVAGGTVEPDDEREWQARRGSLRSEAGDFDAARKSFDRAIELGDVGAMVLLGRLLIKRAAQEGDREAKSDAVKLGLIASSDHASWVPLTWERATVGRRVKLLDDAAEVERLCLRPAPGGEVAVGWADDDEMSAWIGKQGTITWRERGAVTISYCCVKFRTDDDEGGEVGEDEFVWPFDAFLTVQE